MKKYNNIVYDGLTNMAETAVDKFYAFPTEYDDMRTGDLYNAYRVTVNDNVWKIDLDESFMRHEHHQKNELIYENSFVRGYHGGSIGTDKNNITVTVPHYRQPYGVWSQWGAPADKEPESPRAMILDQNPNEYIDLQIQLAVEEYEKAVDVYIDKVYECIDNIL